MGMELSDQELVNKLAQTERDLVSSRFKHSTNQLENTSTLRTLRRDIARLKTEARRREGEQGLPKDGFFAKFRAEAASGSSEGAATKGGFLQGIVDKVSSDE